VTLKGNSTNFTLDVIICNFTLDLKRYVLTYARSIEDVRNEQDDLRKMLARNASPGSEQVSDYQHPAFKSTEYPLKP
jgi:hypothetical protein